VNPVDGLRIATSLLSLNRSQWWPAERIRRYQSEALSRSLRFAVSSVDYYRKLGLTAADAARAGFLGRLPILTKQLLQENAGRLLADGTDIQDCHLSSTSGSTGEPTTVAFDHRTWLLCKYALKIRRMMAWGIGLGKRVLIVSELRPEEIRSQPRVTGSGTLFRQRFVSIHDTVESVIPVIEDFRPNAIYAFPSYFAELVEYCERHGVLVSPVNVIFSSSEVLGDALRDRLMEFFSAKVCDIYGSTEFKEVAAQCQYGSYHLNFESTWIEIGNVNEQGEGDILLTSLVNRAMPLIRYKVGDRGKLGQGDCKCGRNSSWIERVTGREVDMLELPDGRRLSPYLLTAIIETDAALRRYQIVQHGLDRIKIRYIRHAGNQVFEDRLRRELTRLLGRGIRIAFDCVAELPREPSGKQKVFIRDFSPSASGD